MRPRLPGFGSALMAPLLLMSSACGGGAAFKLGSAESAASSPPMVPGRPTATTESGGVMADRAMAPPPPTAPAGTDGAATEAAAPETTSGTPGSSAPVAVATAREMLDIEANVALQVQDVKRAVKQLHELAARIGGVVTAERVDTSSRYGSAQLTLRVPSRSTQAVFEDLEKVGSVLNQTVTARDIGKEFFDANLRLSSLSATLRRYEEILAKASKVEEILRIEQELARLRAEIEQVKGDLRWLSDRAARATLHVSLRERVPEVAYSEEPEPKLYPGLRAPLLLDFGRSDGQLHAGGGVSARFARAFSIDLDVLRRFGSESRGPDVLLISAGGEVYSDLLGSGERRFLNPYLGFRAGYARIEDHNQAIVGGTAGIELFKNRWFDLDLETRHYLAFIGPRGAHYLLEPGLAASVAF
jgi:hypothetical protein